MEPTCQPGLLGVAVFGQRFGDSVWLFSISVYTMTDLQIFWRHSVVRIDLHSLGAGIETRAAHQISPEDFERSRSCIPTVATARNSKRSFCGSEEYMPAQCPARFTPPRQAPFPFSKECLRVASSSIRGPVSSSESPQPRLVERSRNRLA